MTARVSLKEQTPASPVYGCTGIGTELQFQQQLVTVANTLRVAKIQAQPITTSAIIDDGPFLVKARHNKMLNMFLDVPTPRRILLTM